MLLSMSCRRGGGGGRAWGGDLIVFVGPGVEHLTDLVLPGEGIFESLFSRKEIFDCRLGRRRLRPNILLLIATINHNSKIKVNYFQSVHNP